MRLLIQAGIGLALGLVALLVLWNLVGLSLIHTKKMTDISGDALIFFVPQGKTRIYCNGSAIATLETNNINGMRIKEDSYQVFFMDGNMQSYECE